MMVAIQAPRAEGKIEGVAFVSSELGLSWHLLSGLRALPRPQRHSLKPGKWLLAGLRIVVGAELSAP
jgi:hypothetical protein